MKGDQLALPFGGISPPPAPRRRDAETDRLHHLYLDPKKGFLLRVTVVAKRGQKTVGKRVRQWLRTFNDAEAIGRRDAVINAYLKLGLCVANRKIARGASARTSNNPEAMSQPEDDRQGRDSSSGQEAEPLAPASDREPRREGGGQTPGDPYGNY